MQTASISLLWPTTNTDMLAQYTHQCMLYCPLNAPRPLQSGAQDKNSGQDEHARLLYQKVSQPGLCGEVAHLRLGMMSGPMGRWGVGGTLGATTPGSGAGAAWRGVHELFSRWRFALHSQRRDENGEPVFVDFGAPNSRTHEHRNTIAFALNETITEMVGDQAVARVACCRVEAET